MISSMVFFVKNGEKFTDNMVDGVNLQTCTQETYLIKGHSEFDTATQFVTLKTQLFSKDTSLNWAHIILVLIVCLCQFQSIFCIEFNSVVILFQ